MTQLPWWKWFLLALPLVAIALLVLIAASIQIHAWGLSWLWAVVVVVLILWRWGVAHWLVETQATPALPELLNGGDRTAQDQQALQILQDILAKSRDDVPPWENWLLFWQRAHTLVNGIAHVYYPNSQRPLLHIYVPQAYRLLRDTVEDVDRWLQTLDPILSRVTVGQAVRAYELSRQWAPAARWGVTAWQLSQWVLNPSVALTNTLTQGQQQKANQALIANLGLTLREQTLKALGLRAIALYSGAVPSLDLPSPSLQTGTLQDILEETLPLTRAETDPVNLTLPPTKVGGFLRSPQTNS